MFTPTMFFLNFAVASFVTAGLAFYTQNLNYLIPFFVVLSLILLFFLRPLLMNSRRLRTEKTGIEEKYIGKTAKVVETVDKNKGVISIYDERWNARSLNDEIITVGSEVKIIKNESLVLFVEKL